LKLRHRQRQCNPKLAANNETRQRFGVNLEDHLGDILRKARMMSNVSTIAAANAAGISETELSALEESGNTSKKINFSTLAPLLGLNAAKLEGIARGWLPSPKDLSAWRELRQISTIEGGTEVHCYLVWDERRAHFQTGRGKPASTQTPFHHAHAPRPRRSHAAGSRTLSQNSFAHRRQRRAAATP
jgi:hypothetical protein